MKNKIQIVLFAAIIPFMGACQSSTKIKYKVKNIDSTSLSEYYLITTIQSHDSIKIISKKENYQDKIGQIITPGQELSLTLSKVNSLNENGINIRIGNGYLIDGKPIIYKGENIYTTTEIKGLYYKGVVTK